MKNHFHSIFLLFLALSLTACGFKLRGSIPQLDKLPGPIRITGIAPYSALYQEISRQMNKAGIKIESKNAQSVLRISGRQSRSRLLSVDNNNEAVERELEESFTFNLRQPGQAELAEGQQVRVLRILNQPQDERLGSDREAEQLRREMRRELVNQMMRRLYAIQKNLP